MPKKILGGNAFSRQIKFLKQLRLGQQFHLRRDAEFFREDIRALPPAFVKFAETSASEFFKFIELCGHFIFAESKQGLLTFFETFFDFRLLFKAELSRS